MVGCSACLKQIKREPKQCPGCSKVLHESCIFDKIGNCQECVACVICEKKDDLEKCKECNAHFHRACYSVGGFCPECAENIYKQMCSELLFKLECQFHNEVVSLDDEQEKKRIKKILNAGNKPVESYSDHPETHMNKVSKENNKLPCVYIGNKNFRCTSIPPYPTYSPNIFLCSMCLSKFNDFVDLFRHKIKCDLSSPPGKIIYEENSENLQIYEIMGKEYKEFCRNLCTLGKGFIDSKTLHYDVEPFVFYLLFVDNVIAGYFSREKESTYFNLSCIAVFPAFKGKGLGYMLLDISYYLFRLKKLKGTPEKPLSTPGQVLYRNYWKTIVYEYLLASTSKSISINQISNDLSMIEDDVINALEHLNFFSKENSFKIKISKLNLKPLRRIKPEFIKAA